MSNEQEADEEKVLEEDEQEADEENVLEEYDDKWSNPTGSYYYALVLPNGDVEYHGSKSAIRTRLNELYADD